MITSCFMPVVSGNCQIFAGSLPAMHAAADAASAPAAPEVIIPDSAPVSSANRRPAPFCSSTMFTKWCEASVCAALTSGNCSEPLKYVHVPRQLITVFTPSFVYTFSCEARPNAPADFAYKSFAAICAKSGDAARYFMKLRRLDPRVRDMFPPLSPYFVKTSVPKCSGTWFGSRLTTHVGCQHMKCRCGSSPSPSMRYKFTRHLEPALIASALTDFSGTRAAAYQMCFPSSIRPSLCQPESHFAS